MENQTILGGVPRKSKLRPVREFLRKTGKIAWKAQKTPAGKFWAFLFLLGNFSVFEWLMAVSRVIGGERYFVYLAAIPAAYLLLSVHADIYFIGHFSENYKWRDHIRFQSIIADRISHRGIRKAFSVAFVGSALFLCGTMMWMQRLGVFVLLTQEDIPAHWGRKLLYLGTCVRIVLTFFGVRFLAS